MVQNNSKYSFKISTWQFLIILKLRCYKEIQPLTAVQPKKRRDEKNTRKARFEKLHELGYDEEDRSDKEEEFLYGPGIATNCKIRSLTLFLF